MNPFLQVLEKAAQDRQTHHERAAAQTRAHFAAHPECQRVIVSMDKAGNVTRGMGLVDVESRCKPGWFQKSMWKGNEVEEMRPIESAGAEIPLLFSVGASGRRAVEVNPFLRTYLRELRRSMRRPDIGEVLARPNELRTMRLPMWVR